MIKFQSFGLQIVIFYASASHVAGCTLRCGSRKSLFAGQNTEIYTHKEIRIY